MKFKLVLTFFCFIYLDTESSANFLNVLRGTNCDTNSDRVAIHSKWNHGCLDVSDESDTATGKYLLFLSKRCPGNSDAHFNWKFEPNGTLSTEGDDNKLWCLECALGQVDCVLIVRPCNGKNDQQFLITIYPNQIDYENGRSYFSINSMKNPTRCLTVYYRYYKIPPNSHSFKYTAIRFEKCSGKIYQTFYFSKNWSEEIEDFFEEVNGMY